ncbi:Uncharacterised protein [Klebsiella quasipneumoniae]|nr:Uncharacterised protein [Klebsiella quasipneumoniae]SCA18334.1 Uncharacterised protein [Klebsiella quasipneumoniae]
MDYTKARNIRPLSHFANSQFALRNYCEFAISVRNTTVSIRQVVRTLNAQFCCEPDCVLRTSGANLNIWDGLNHVLASSHRLGRV